jgi:hypothetical protein
VDPRRLFPVLLLLLCLGPQRTAAGAWISEIRVDEPGPDTDEYFELSGTPGESLQGLTYLVLGDGPAGSGQIEAVISLDGQVVPDDGVFLVTESTYADLAEADVVTLLNFENGDNTTHLLVRGFSGSLDDDLDRDNDCWLDETPWTEMVDAVALMVEPNPPRSTECHYGLLGATAGPDGSFAPGAVVRCGDVWLVGGFGFGTDDTPGAANRHCRLAVHAANVRPGKARFR